MRAIVDPPFSTGRGRRLSGAGTFLAVVLNLGFGLVFVALKTLLAHWAVSAAGVDTVGAQPESVSPPEGRSGGTSSVWRDRPDGSRRTERTLKCLHPPARRS